MTRYVAPLLTLLILLSPAGRADEAGWRNLSAEGLDAWREPRGQWFEAEMAEVHPHHPNQLVGDEGKGVLINGVRGKTEHLVSVDEFGDVELELEWMVPRASNSGVYLMGRYEIQILDSYGVEEPAHSDAGGIYQRYKDDHTVPQAERGFDGRAPRVNASRKPGEWQKFEITFRAPRFDAKGNKVENARFVKVVHNGQVVHENEELSGPTRSAMFEDEQAKGPIMIQGNHGPVAIRNVRVREVD